MAKKTVKPGRDELVAVLRRSRHLFWFVGLFSIAVNLLMLTGPLYMMQVYDRVLGSRSEETLVALTVLVAFLYGMMGILDAVRGRVMRRVAARFQASLDERVFDAMVRRSSTSDDVTAQTGLGDLETIQRLIASPVVLSAFDIPFTPIFLAGIALFHPWLGILALSGGLVLVLIAILNQVMSQESVKKATLSSHLANQASEDVRKESEMVQAMGMRRAAYLRWQKLRTQSLADNIGAADTGGSFSTLTKTLRLFLQSAMLGLGAYLVLANQVTAGAIIASSVLMGRALAPVEQGIGQWANIQRARRAWNNLADLLAAVPPEETRLELPKPKGLLEVQNLTVMAPGEKAPQLKGINFTVRPGKAVGVIGPSGAGKTTLARALTGTWPPTMGTVRLDGAALAQYSPEALGHHIGYLPQRVQLFEGTIAENIARFDPNMSSEQVVSAASKAAAHDLIVKLPGGYDTRLPPNGGRLSGGQMQRIGLARALYGDPAVVILDEPNSNLDNEGSQALNHAIRQLKANGKTVFIMAHRPAAIQECDMLLMIDQGAMTAFGDKDEVLKKVVNNYNSIAAAKAAQTAAPQEAAPKSATKSIALVPAAARSAQAQADKSTEDKPVAAPQKPAPVQKQAIGSIRPAIRVQPAEQASKSSEGSDT